MASIRSDLFNAHFRGPYEVGYIAEDFMGTGNRTVRQAEWQAQRMKDQAELLMTQAALARIDRNTPEDLIPDWARR